MKNNNNNKLRPVNDATRNYFSSDMCYKYRNKLHCRLRAPIKLRTFKTLLNLSTPLSSLSQSSFGHVFQATHIIRYNTILNTIYLKLDKSQRSIYNQIEQIFRIINVMFSIESIWIQIIRGCDILSILFTSLLLFVFKRVFSLPAAVIYYLQ